MRAIRAYCAITGHPEPEVFHTNEGHAGFLGLERIRTYAAQDLNFDEALEACRAGTVFTTHTPVPAGIDRFPRDLVERYFSKEAGDPALPVERVLALGAETYPGGDPHVFNMAVMGMRLAQRVNGVSKLHGAVSRADVLRPVARVRGSRGPDRLHHQRRAPGDLGRQRGPGARRPGRGRAE